MTFDVTEQIIKYLEGEENDHYKFFNIFVQKSKHSFNTILLVSTMLIAISIAFIAFEFFLFSSLILALIIFLGFYYWFHDRDYNKKIEAYKEAWLKYGTLVGMIRQITIIEPQTDLTELVNMIKNRFQGKYVGEDSHDEWLKDFFIIITNLYENAKKG